MVDDEIKRLNREIARAREQRSLIEDRLTLLLAMPAFAGYDKLSVNADKSVIKIKRPLAWEKPWSLSRSVLRDMIFDYFREAALPAAGPVTAIGCYQYILLRNKKMSTEFSLERIVQGDAE
jgi:hypothetical protein